MPIKCPHCGNVVPTVEGTTDERKHEEWIAPHRKGWLKGRCPGSLETLRVRYETEPAEPRNCYRCGKEIDMGAWLMARDPRGKPAYIYPGKARGSLEVTEEKIVHYDCLQLTEHMDELTERRMELVEEVVVKKDWARALSILDEIQDPSDPTDWYTKGNMLRNLGRHEEAAKCFDEAIFLDTHYVKAWYRKGQALADMDQFHNSVTCLENVLTLENWLKEAWNRAQGRGNWVFVTGVVKDEITSLGPASKSSVSVVRDDASPLGLVKSVSGPSQRHWSQAAFLLQTWAILKDANNRLAIKSDNQPTTEEWSKIMRKIAFTYFMLLAYPEFASRLPRVTEGAAGDIITRVMADFIPRSIKEILDVVQPQEVARIYSYGERH